MRRTLPRHAAARHAKLVRLRKEIAAVADWSAEDDAMLTRLWADPANSTARMGEMMGHRSKNSIVGRAHRIGLPARPSPIRRDGAVQPARSARTQPALPPLPSAVAPPRTSVLAIPLVARAAPVVRPAPVTLSAPARIGPVRACCWPFGEPRTKAFRFCGDPALPGRSYCDDHQAASTGRGTASERAAHRVSEETA
jgi:GcrA cell cycle regulator